MARHLIHIGQSRAAMCLSLLALTVLISACSAPRHSFDYRNNHQIKVGSEQVSILLTVPDEGTQLKPLESRRWDRFLRDYVNRGRGRVFVERESNVGLADNQNIRRIQSFLKRQGLGDRQITMTPLGDDSLDGRQVRLTFTANKAIVPECGQFSKDLSYNPRNLQHENFGCATQRNLGLMVVDPGDLVRARPFSGIDPERELTVVTDDDADTTTDDTATTTTSE